MDTKRNRRPRWTMLNLIMLLAVGGLILEHDLHLTPTGHKVVLFVIVVVVYGLMGKWADANAAALEDLDAERRQQQWDTPAPHGTQERPPSTQAHYRQAISYNRHETPHE